ncbi:hypothetical protein EV643_121158 [Kribbella sp. VKM Ac-2527]|uniref:DUF2637 domain-containing protein n=1 Tax=Kribbella caucasensis TaxID=2512215 RepID=A0A4R6JIB2_9ACTN|nr:hypothetical protein [Kribbella sp. VKM Ac-2527]TDO35883.1 hypothetical protein EV643_121158 [Kribbella sp. VKM Ac-2527]
MSTLVRTSEIGESGKAKRSGVERLRVAAAEASQVRALSTHPDVVALRVESIRTQVDRCMWLGIVLGLAFTMVNVQDFAARGAAVFSLAWFAAWLLDPMVSLVLIAVLRAEQITARYQVSDVGPWIGRTKRFAFAATYAMNTWSSFLKLDVAGIVLHSVPPLLVFCAAETAPVLRDRLTEAVLRAEQAAALADPVKAAESLEMPPAGAGTPPAPAALVASPAAPTESEPTHVARKPGKPRKKATAKHGRKLLADYVADALAAVEPDVEITPAWARRVSGCSAGLSAKVAAAVRAELSNRTTTAASAAVETTTDDAADAGDLARAAA